MFYFWIVQNTTLTDFFLNNLLIEQRTSRLTVKAYESDLRQFDVFLKDNFDEATFIALSYLEIRSWIVSLSEKELSPTSINRKIATLKSFYKYLIKNKYVEIDPTTKINSLKSQKKPPQFLEEKSLNQLFDGIDFPHTFEGKRDKLILLLLYTSGIRLAELISLKYKDVDTTEFKITVSGKRNKQRVIPIPESLLLEMQAYNIAREELNVENELYFLKKDGKSLYPVLVQRLVKDYLSKVTSIKKKTPHVLRHSYATHLLNNGAELNAIKDLLGHSSLAATQIYTHNSIDKLKKVHKRAHPSAKKDK